MGDPAGARLLPGPVAHECIAVEIDPERLRPRRDGAGGGPVQDPKTPGLGSRDPVRAYDEGSARVLAPAYRVDAALSLGDRTTSSPCTPGLCYFRAARLFPAPSFPEKSADALAAVRALLAFCLPPTCAVSFVLTSPHRTFAGASGPPRGFNPKQVPNPRMERYTDPKALQDRRRSEPEWGTLSTPSCTTAGQAPRRLTFNPKGFEGNHIAGQMVSCLPLRKGTTEPKLRRRRHLGVRNGSSSRGRRRIQRAGHP